MTVTHKFQHSGIGRSCLVCGQGKGHELHALPTFEAGKSYRTRGGRLMKITKLTPDSLVGTEQNHDAADRHAIFYDVDGKASGTGWSAFDLLPGAIEDEPKAESDAVKAYRAAHNGCIPGDPGWTRPGAIEDETAALQAEINQRKSAAVDPICVLQGQIDLMREAITVLQADAISRNEREFPDFMHLCPPEPGTATVDREYRSDLRQIHSRLNRQAERFEELTAELTSFRNHKAWDEMTAVLGRIEEHERRLDAFAIEICGKAGVGFAEDHHGRIHALEQRVNRLRFEKAMSEGAYGGTPKPTHPAFDPDPPKPTIKGGWVNFYPDKGWQPSFHSTRELADRAAGASRIACIQIPDITEGEGL